MSGSPASLSDGEVHSAVVLVTAAMALHHAALTNGCDPSGMRCRETARPLGPPAAKGLRRRDEMSARSLRKASTTVAIAVAIASFGATRQAAAAIPSRNGPDSSGTVWLCRPGQSDDPCTANLTATLIRANGKREVQRVTPAKGPPIDCFYVYPTVSRQKTPNADLHIDPEETAVAIAQASRFSQVCKVYAPMYPQLTTSGIGLGGAQISPKAAVTAYLGVLSAWNDYLAHDNHGRGVVLIGHSQGASLLIRLIRNQIDSNSTERRLLVSALLMGGNVTVPVGQTVGGSFQHVPACQSDSETGCVVAYSSFNTTPPSNSFYGRVGSSIGSRSQLGTSAPAGLQVLCTNPASLDGGAATLDPYFVTKVVPGARGDMNPQVNRKVTTPWVGYPNLYSATCQTSDGASWLQVTSTRGSRDHRPVVKPALGPRWGLHLVDVNIALGNLVDLVRRQAASYSASTS